MFKVNDYVKIIIKDKEKNKDKVNSNYYDYDNQTGIISKIDDSWGTRYILYYEDNDFRKIDTKNGGVFILEEDIVSMNIENLELVNRMEKEKEEKEYKRIYAWGKCEKCEGPLDMHYKKWCPSCTEPHELVSDGCIDILMCLTWCEVRRKGIKDRIWNYFCDNWDFSNDTIKRQKIEDWLDDTDEDFIFIANNFKNLGIKYIEFSW